MVKDREAWHAACSPWGGNESDMTEQLNNNILMAGSKEELNNLLMRVKEDSERAGLRLILKTLRSWHLPPLLLLLLLLSRFSLVQLCVTT